MHLEKDSIYLIPIGLPNTHFSDKVNNKKGEKHGDKKYQSSGGTVSGTENGKNNKYIKNLANSTAEWI